MTISVVPRSLSLIINGTNYSKLINGPVRLEQLREPLSGLILFTADFDLVRLRLSNPALNPKDNTDLQRGARVTLEYGGQPLPFFHTLYLAELTPKRATPNNAETASIKALCKLGYYRTQKRKSAPIKFDPTLGTPYQEIIEYLLKIQGIDSVDFGTALPELAQIEIQKLDNNSLIDFAGSLVFGAPNGPWYLYADTQGIVRVLNYNTVLNSTPFDIDEPYIIDYQELNPQEQLDRVSVYKLSGNLLSVEVCPDGAQIVEQRELKSSLSGVLFFGSSETYISFRTITTVSNVDNDRIEVVEEYQQNLRVHKSPSGGITGFSFLGLVLASRITNTYTYNADGLLTRKSVYSESGIRINGLLTGSTFPLYNTITTWVLDNLNNIETKTIKYHERLVLINGTWTYKPELNLNNNLTHQLIDIGGLQETWTPLGCFWQHVTSVASGAREMFGRPVVVVFTPTGNLKSETVSDLPSPETRPGAYTHRERIIHACTYAQSGNYVPPNIDFTQESIEFISNQNTLEQIAFYEHLNIWGLACGDSFVLPILDTWLNSTEPLMLFNAINNRYVWDNISIAITDVSALTTLSAPLLSSTWTISPCLAELDSNRLGTDLRLSARNRVVYGVTNTNHSVLANIPITDKRYWEVYDADNIRAGIADSAHNTSTPLTNSFASIDNIYDVLGFAYDGELGILNTYRNGVLINTQTGIAVGLHPAISGTGTGFPSARLAILDDLIYPLPSGFLPYFGTQETLDGVYLGTTDGQIKITTDGRIKING